MGELRLTIGLPGSGKSEYAKKLLDSDSSWRRINWDEWRKDRGMHLRNFNRKEEEVMQKESIAFAEALGLEGVNIIVDNTNLNESTRNRWKGVAQRAGMSYVEIAMSVSLEECIARDAKREGIEQCGRAVIERMALFADLIPWQKSHAYVIVDMDGTLADCSHRIHHVTKGNHDWDLFESKAMEDKPRWPIINLVRILRSKGYDILIVSGRQIDRAGKSTVQWLDKYNIQYDHIFMRNGGDNRQDSIVKQEILDKLPKDQIRYVLDDRNQVVEMWRKNGLTCLQVADGNF
jgi:predicted kinase